MSRESEAASPGRRWVNSQKQTQGQKQEQTQKQTQEQEQELMDSNSKIDVSVVVPVFNQEKYLEQCVDSLLCQTLKRVEFIFVDDGSTDRSMEILERYRAVDDRIKTLTQKNQYAGVARNNGMNIATGKYIIFVDSDDFFAPTMLEDAFEHAERFQAEITIFGFSKLDDMHKTVHKIPYAPFPNACFSVKEIGEDFFLKYNAEPWNKLFLRSFVTRHGLTFQDIRKCNDTYFTHMAAYLSDKIVYLRKRLMFYRVNNTASLQGNVSLGQSAFIQMAAAIKKGLIDKELYYGVYKKAYHKYLYQIIRLYGNADSNVDSYRDYYYKLKEAMIPELFDSADDFSSDEWVSMLYESEDMESFLLSYVSYLKKNYISKKSKDYKIGHTLLIVPRIIKRVIETHSL